METTKVSNTFVHRSSNIDSSLAFNKNDVLSVLLASAKLNGAYSSVKIHLLQDMCGSDSMSCNCCPITPSPSFDWKQVTTRNACHTSPFLNISTLLVRRVQPLLYAPLPNFKPDTSSFNGCSKWFRKLLRARVLRSCSIHRIMMLRSKRSSRLILGARSDLNTLCFLSVGHVSMSIWKVATCLSICKL